MSKKRQAKNGQEMPPVFDPVCDQMGHPGRALSYYLHAVDPDHVDTVTYALLNNPPPGAAIDRNSGQFTWTPTAQQMGSWPITVQATESGAGLTSVTQFRVNVINVCPTVPSIPTQSTRVGQTLTYYVNATDPDGDLPLVFMVLPGSQGSFPGGTNPYTFTPTAQGNYNVQIQVSDALGGATPASFSVQVMP